RRVSARVREASGVETPTVRLARTVGRLRGGTTPDDLPPRLSLFGHTRITRSDAALLAALAEHHDVHLWLPQSSARLWERLAPDAARGPVPRAAVPTPAAEHPLLEALGRDARELQRVLGEVGAQDAPVPAGAPPAATPCSVGCSATCATTARRRRPRAPSASSAPTT